MPPRSKQHKEEKKKEIYLWLYSLRVRLQVWVSDFEILSSLSPSLNRDCINCVWDLLLIRSVRL